MSELAGLRILAWVHKYVGMHNAGAEWMLHDLLVEAVRRGARATVVPVRGGAETTVDGVLVADRRRVQPSAMFAGAQLVVTHLDMTREACLFARRARRPLVHLIHNDRQLTFHHVHPNDATAVVANSEWIAASVPEKYGTPLVIPPPTPLDRYRPVLGPHDRVVLSNLTLAKGADVFYAMAKRLPDVRFLGVKGAYGQQILRDLPNVEIIDHSTDVVGDVFARARMVLMPSSYESWGRVAIEASACGVPVLWATTPGLAESMGSAGIRCERDDLDAWERGIRRLISDTGYHASIAARGRARAIQLDPAAPGGAFDRWCRLLATIRTDATTISGLR